MKKQCNPPPRARFILIKYVCHLFHKFMRLITDAFTHRPRFRVGGMVEGALKNPRKTMHNSNISPTFFHPCTAAFRRRRAWHDNKFHWPAQWLPVPLCAVDLRPVPALVRGHSFVAEPLKPRPSSGKQTLI